MPGCVALKVVPAGVFSIVASQCLWHLFTILYGFSGVSSSIVSSMVSSPARPQSTSDRYRLNCSILRCRSCLFLAQRNKPVAPPLHTSTGRNIDRRA